MTKSVLKTMIAVCMYGALAAYLYEPYWARLERWSYLIPMNHVIGALGAMVLVHRWVRSDSGRLITGALYGFGPHFFYISRYHPFVGLLFALLGWMFLPAAHMQASWWHGFYKRSAFLQYIIKGCVWALPLGVCFLFFWVSTTCRRFVAPVQASRLYSTDWLSLVMPLVAMHHRAVLFGVWHIPLAGLMIGLVLTCKARRWGLLLLTCGCLGLAFCRPVVGIGPVVWLSISSLWAAVLTGLGIEALSCAGRRDVKWILVVTVLMAMLCIVSLGLGWFVRHEPQLMIPYLDTSRLFALSTVVLALLLIVMRAGWRMHALRWLLLLGACGLDIVLSTQYVIDHV
jgi:hypothetical protein